MPIVSPAELHVPVREADQAAVGNRHAMGIAAEIVKHLLRAAERPLSINNPCDRRSPGKENGM